MGTILIWKEENEMAITTGKVRASYVSIFQPKAPQGGGEPKYSVTLLIPKNDAATINGVYAEIERAKQEGAQKAFGGNVPPVCKIPLYDGDGVQPSGVPFGDECKGHMVLRASAKLQPVIVDVNKQNIINPADVYSGCYVRASINFFAYNTNGNKGIGCGLNAVQKVEDGEPLIARVSAEEAFGGSNTYSAAPAITYPGAVPAAPYAAGSPYPGAAPAVSYPPGGPYPQMPAGNYQQAAPMTYPVQPAPVPTAYPQQPGQQIDPITGRAMLTGGVMGLQ